MTDINIVGGDASQVIGAQTANDTPVVADDVLTIDASAAEVRPCSMASIQPRTIQEITASGAVTPGVACVELNHTATTIAATVAATTAHPGLFVIKNTSASGTAAHAVTLTAGTYDGTSTIATLNAPNECLVVYFDSAGNGTIVENVGSVALSGP